MLGLAGLLVAARYLQPTEGAAFGETLWQSQLWIAAAAAWCWFAVRSGAVSLRFGLADGFVVAMAVGHALSTVPVLVHGGDRRAAVNLAWEWVGLAATVFLLRQLLPGREFRRPVAAAAAVIAAVAALGLWQHHVAFPSRAAAYRTLAAEEADLAGRVAAGSATAASADRLAAVRREFAELGRPPEPSGRTRFENRLFGVEPLGPYALTNTLGGLLAAAVPLLAAASLFGSAARPTWARFALIAAAAGSTYCLVLTKSRTAWVGLVVGTVAAVALNRAGRRLSRRTAVIAAGGVAVLVAALVVATAAGGLDVEVLSEAPKSLRYRLEYWTGALSVLSERPLLGTGPANFRGYYLEHRPAGASEAVAAPHNLFLDVWAYGGLLSLLGLVGLIGLGGWRLLRPSAEPDETGVFPAWTAFETAAVAAFPAVFVLHWIAGNGLDWPLLAVAPVASVVLAALVSPNGPARFGVGVGAAWAAVAVHLLGADGIELPAVTQTLFLLAALLDRPRVRAPAGAARFAPPAGFAVLALACFLTGLVPVLNGGALLARAESRVAAGDPSAERVIEQAADADPLSTRPPLMLAELASARAEGSRSSTDFEAAERRWAEFLDAVPRDVHARRRLAAVLTVRHDATGDPAFAERAAGRLLEAVDLSPTDAGLRAEAAAALETAGRSAEAAEQARAAVRLDDLNRAAGHSDQILPAATRAEAERLAAVGAGRGGP